MRYYLDLEKIPRSVGRIEWKQIWRDKRVMEKKCIIDEEQKITMLRLDNLSARIRRDLIDDIIYPVIILGPYQ